ncbi:hypothetical protein EMA8858_00856 [Emticicia aquatica]|uniref:Rubredoxin-like domain-containing protein n=1 Tax=Emticicia aquatica TaxID=1681835 RepID=A0ABM9AN95_9BACT|nr:rubredoxin domain-containing protein [Emticicia aquatica]CAH0994744.1 hypothetical protein EMA8858_00856 [Emticicia aquatica]
MKDFYTIRVNFKGGIASPGELKNILLAAQESQVHEVRFGLRQQLILHLLHPFARTFEQKMILQSIDFQSDSNEFPNIISSYVAEEVFQKGNWLTEGIYKDILDLFDYKSLLKINLSDNQQSFTPYFSGHLNFIASENPNFWYLYIRLPKTNKVFSFDKLIFSNEIPKLCKQLEERILSNENPYLEDIEQLFLTVPTLISLPKENELEPANFTLPYYEGFNRYGKKTWLGIYRRNEFFSVKFLIKLCELCQETKIGEICLTPFKSLIIKGIDEVNRGKWSNILSEFNINVRHAANELNWQVEDDSDEALQLKLSLVEAFDKQDLRTFGLCFGIKTRPKTEVYASIMVQRRRFKLFNFIPFYFVYDISYTEDFNPNGRTKKYFEKSILRFNLAEQLRRNVLKYNKMIAENAIKTAGLRDDHKETEVERPSTKKVHQCKHCFTIYDADFGDLVNNIPAGIPFSKLPTSYICPTCEAEKKDFKAIEVKIEWMNM